MIDNVKKYCYTINAFSNFGIENYFIKTYYRYLSRVSAADKKNIRSDA